jgi:hypothetical protein
MALQQGSAGLGVGGNVTHACADGMGPTGDLAATESATGPTDGESLP